MMLSLPNVLIYINLHEILANLHEILAGCISSSGARQFYGCEIGACLDQRTKKMSKNQIKLYESLCTSKIFLYLINITRFELSRNH